MSRLLTQYRKYKNRGWIDLFFEEVPVANFAYQVWKLGGGVKKRVQDLQEAQLYVDEILKIGAKNYAISYLARYSVSKSKLKQKLKECGIEEDLAQEVTDFCVEKRYIDESYLLERKVEQSISKGYGKRHIISQLRAKGIEPHLIENEMPEELNELENIKKLLRKWKIGPDTDEKERQKAFNRLMNRGFDYERVMEVWSQNQS